MSALYTIIALVALLAVAGGAIWLAGRKAGGTAERERAESDTVAALRRSQQAAADAPVGKEAIINRLREKGL